MNSTIIASLTIAACAVGYATNAVAVDNRHKTRADVNISVPHSDQVFVTSKKRGSKTLKIMVTNPATGKTEVFFVHDYGDSKIHVNTPPDTVHFQDSSDGGSSRNRPRRRPVP